MKTSYIKFFVTAFLVVSTAFQSFAQISKVDIIATGLTCSMCSNAINKQLKSLNEVDKIETDLNTNTFSVFFKNDMYLEPNVLKNAVEKAGFFVGSMVLTTDFTKQAPANTGTLKLNDATFYFVDAAKTSFKNAERFQVVDKGYVTQKEFKKMSKTYAKQPEYNSENVNIYHLKAI